MLNLKYKDFIDQVEPKFAEILKEHDLTYPNLTFSGYSKLLSQLIDVAWEAKYPNEDKLIK